MTTIELIAQCLMLLRREILFPSCPWLSFNGKSCCFEVYETAVSFTSWCVVKLTLTPYITYHHQQSTVSSVDCWWYQCHNVRIHDSSLFALILQLDHKIFRWRLGVVSYHRTPSIISFSWPILDRFTWSELTMLKLLQSKLKFTFVAFEKLHWI